MFSEREAELWLRQTDMSVETTQATEGPTTLRMDAQLRKAATASDLAKQATTHPPSLQLSSTVEIHRRRKPA